MELPKTEISFNSSFFEGDERFQQMIPGHATGKIFVDMGMITSGQLRVALRRNKILQETGRGKSLGVLLVEMGYITSKNYLDALSRYYDLPVISLWNFIPSFSLQALVGHRYAYHHKIIVFSDSDTQVKLALAEPTVLIMEELKKVFAPRKEIKFYLANPFEVESRLQKCCDPYSQNFCH